MSAPRSTTRSAVGRAAARLATRLDSKADCRSIGPSNEGHPSHSPILFLLRTPPARRRRPEGRTAADAVGKRDAVRKGALMCLGVKSSRCSAPPWRRFHLGPLPKCKALQARPAGARPVRPTAGARSIPAYGDLWRGSDARTCHRRREEIGLRSATAVQKQRPAHARERV